MTIEYKTWEDVSVDSLKKEMITDTLIFNIGDSLEYIIENVVKHGVDISKAIVVDNSTDYYSSEMGVEFLREETDDEFSERCIKFQKKMFKQSKPTPKQKAKQNAQHQKDLEMYNTLKLKLGL